MLQVWTGPTPVGLGQLVEDDYVGDGGVFYCPSPTFEGTERNHEHFRAKWGISHNIYGHYVVAAFRITDGWMSFDTLPDELPPERALMADSTAAGTASNGVMLHNDEYVNILCVDGGVTGKRRDDDTGIFWKNYWGGYLEKEWWDWAER